jgi:hypothetical protein
MPHESKTIEELKIAREAKWAALGREIADTATRQSNMTGLLTEARIMRQIEQSRADRQTRFAALARQVGDAAASGKPLAPLLQQLADLRALELGPPPG